MFMILFLMNVTPGMVLDLDVTVFIVIFTFKFK